MVIKAEESNKSETGSLITKRHTHTYTLSNTIAVTYTTTFFKPIPSRTEH